MKKNKLSDYQWIFVQNKAKLIEFAARNGFKLTDGEAFRTEDQQWLYMNGYTIEKGKLIDGKKRSTTNKSNHLNRLAQDFNVFVNDELTYDPEKIRLLGSYWKKLHVLNRWGGDWMRLSDAGHFEMNL